MKLENGTVSPAYGRDYKNSTAAKAAFLEGKDFVNESINRRGMYCSVRDFEAGALVSVRFNKLQKVVLVEVPHV